jgi:hypothetical protein
MSQHTVLEIAAPQCAAQDFEGEIIALNLTTGTYYSLRDLGAVLWRDLAAGHAVESLAALAAGPLGSPEPVARFAARAQAEGLLRPSSSPVLSVAAPLLGAALAGGTSEIVFEVYEDMQSLFLLDPVHEVDETRGWPTLPTSA